VPGKTEIVKPLKGAGDQRSIVSHAAECPRSERFNVGALMGEERVGFDFDAMAVSELDECVEPRACRGNRPPVEIPRDRGCAGFDVSLEGLMVALQEREP
jgi:hypothetical protein